jgi:hypothetical protein
MKSQLGPPMTLGDAAAARVLRIVWCKACGHRVTPDPTKIAERYDAETAVPAWRERLVCSDCGNRQVDTVVTGMEGMDPERTRRGSCNRGSAMG